MSFWVGKKWTRALEKQGLWRLVFRVGAYRQRSATARPGVPQIAVLSEIAAEKDE